MLWKNDPCQKLAVIIKFNNLLHIIKLIYLFQLVNYWHVPTATLSDIALLFAPVILTLFMSKITIEFHLKCQNMRKQTRWEF